MRRMTLAAVMLFSVPAFAQDPFAARRAADALEDLERLERNRRMDEDFRREDSARIERQRLDAEKTRSAEALQRARADGAEAAVNVMLSARNEEPPRSWLDVGWLADGRHVRYDQNTYVVLGNTRLLDMAIGEQSWSVAVDCISRKYAFLDPSGRYVRAGKGAIKPARDSAAAILIAEVCATPVTASAPRKSR